MLLNKIPLFLFLIFSCAVFSAKAQLPANEKERYHQFAGENPAGVGSYYLVCIKGEKEKKLLQQQDAIFFHRQFNDSVFIISLRQSSLQESVKRSCRWLVPANTNWKLSPALLQQHSAGGIAFPATMYVSVYNAAAFSKKMLPANIQSAVPGVTGSFVVRATGKTLFSQLLQDENVFFIATCNTKPAEELQINSLDLGENKINLLHSKQPLLNGSGIVLSIKENLPDTTDIDFAARYLPNPLQAPAVTVHASIMATMAAGAGNSWYLGRGVADAAGITGSDFRNLLPDDTANYRQYHISVQNHSYGVGIENFYGADAAAFDATAVSNDSLLFVFSAGNSGALSSASGNYVAVPGVANLTGSFKMAKNIITVGAVDSFGRVAAASSRGPAYDGRIKPELVAYGEDGTSGAAALVSGTAALLQHAYKAGHGNQLPPAALVKALLINSAEDVGAPGIDFISGYGNLNAGKAAEAMQQSRFFEGNIAAGDNRFFDITIPPGIKKAIFTLVWTDPPATPNAFRAIVNDLDLQLQLPVTLQSWQPWVLNAAANTDSLQALPRRKRDSLNTVEQITLDNPAAGNYRLQVNAFNVTGQQPFYIAWQLDSSTAFAWTFPSSADNIFPGAYNLIRWTADTNVADAALYYSLNGGSTWQGVSTAINSAQQYHYWNAPDTNATGLLKMQVGTREFISDTFTISKKTDLTAGFNCNDSVLWYWQQLRGIDQYQLYALQNGALQPVTTVADTRFVFNKNALPYHYYAVAPLIGGRAGVKSYAADYRAQTAGCYVSNLVTDLVNNNSAGLRLTLGTLYRVKKIVFEKLQSNGFVALYEVPQLNGFDYAFTDASLSRGINVYRVRLQLDDGQTIYSFTSSVFYFAGTDVIVFPNPVRQGNTITIQMEQLQNQEIRITDVTGRTVFRQTAPDLTVQVPCNFSKGLYFLSVYDPVSRQTRRFSIAVQ